MKLNPESLFSVIKGTAAQRPFEAGKMILGPGLIALYTTLEEAESHQRQAVDRLDNYEKDLRDIEGEPKKDPGDDIPF
jgi:hypothetical protein